MLEAGDRVQCQVCGRRIMLVWWSVESVTGQERPITFYGERGLSMLVLQPHRPSRRQHGPCDGTVQVFFRTVPVVLLVHAPTEAGADLGRPPTEDELVAWDTWKMAIEGVRRRNVR